MLKKIHDQITCQRKEEDRNPPVRFKALARIDAELDQLSTTFWIVHTTPQNRINENLGGPVINARPRETYTQDGHRLISKGSLLGSKLSTQENWNDEINYTDPKGNQRTFKIKNFTSYNPRAIDRSATQLKIDLGDKKFQFNRLADLTKYLRFKELDKKTERKQEDQHEYEQLGRIFSTETGMGGKPFIRDSEKLMYVSILDPRQNQIKIAHVYDGNALVVTGGPGTGKTSLLIHRIKFLVDPAMLEEIGNPFRQNSPRWLFISPSQHLYQYLRSAMISEELEPTATNVVVWKDQVQKIAKALGIIKDSDGMGYFTFDQTHHTFLGMSAQNLGILKTSFAKYHRNTVKSKLLKAKSLLEKINLNELHTLLNYLQKTLHETNEVNIDTILYNLKQNHAASIARICASETRLLGDLVNKIYTELETAHPGCIQFIDEDILKTTINIETSEENEESDENELEPQDLTERRKKIIRSWIRKHHIHSLTKDQKFNQKEQKLGEWLAPITIMDLSLVQKIVLKQHILPLTKGKEAILLKDVEKCFLGFRQSEAIFNLLNMRYQDSLSKRIIRLDELNFLIGYTIDLVRSLGYPSDYALTNQIKDFSFEVIGVDECTDFSLLEIYAMESLLLKRGTNYSFTMVGDLMQTMTRTGFTNWEDLSAVFGDKIEVMKLTQSFRQSETLINLAKQLQHNTIGQDLVIQPRYGRYANEPAPLLYQSSDFEDRILWVADRILEIKKAYGQEDFGLPSTAILALGQENIDKITTSLIELLKDQVPVVKGTMESNTTSGSVAVYDIMDIKGLEFQACFIFDIDTISESAGDNLANKSIFVGISRAVFYLGATASHNNDYVRNLKAWGFVEGNWE